jgi:polysaccharide pyruvyl transferase WcaK-like protein
MKSFALLSPCGHGNLGDAAIQDAVIQAIRRRVSLSLIYGITLRPADTEKRHGILSFPIGQGAIEPQDSPQGPDSHSEKISTRAIAVGLQQNMRRLLARCARKLFSQGWPWVIRMELAHLMQSARLLKDVDMLIVSGGGQLDDFWGGSWGHPYALFKWSVLARVTNTRVIVLGTGFGTLGSWLSRFFVRTALRLSDYCSYRDQGSKELMKRAGFHRDDPVCPDLAFSLDVNVCHTREHRDAHIPMQVCISPMVYCDPRTWPRKDAGAYQCYVEKLAALTISLLQDRYRVVLVASNGSDNRVVEELRDSVASRLQGTPFDLHCPEVGTVEQFLRYAMESRVVIASRKHGVLLAQLVGTPVIALSYERKVKVLMDQMQQPAFCLDIDSFDPNQALRLFHALEEGWQQSHETIMKKNREHRELLDQQYDRVILGLNGYAG